MTLNSQALIDAVRSHVLTTGVFDKARAHEAKSAPGKALSVDIWVDRIDTIRSSGLNSTSGRVVLSVRVYKTMLSEPQDAIDPEIMGAVDALFASFIGDFTLGGLIRKVDVRGAEGVALSARAGYLEIGGEGQRRQYRVFVISLPLLINDCWTESP